MADTEKPTVTATPDKASLPEVDLTKYKVRQANNLGSVNEK